MKQVLTNTAFLSVIVLFLSIVPTACVSEHEVFDRAEWIWCEGDPVPENFYLYCRKSVDLPPGPASAEVNVTADSRYQLFVNGEYVGRGPARYDQRWMSYDSYDILPFLQEGENVISAIVHQYGVETHSYVLGKGGFLLQGEVQKEDGSSAMLKTDDSWKVLEAPPWEREVPRSSFAIGWMEIFDARKEPAGWKEPGFDDAGWQEPVILGRHPVEPWIRLVPSGIPPLLEEEWFPVAVLEEGEVRTAPENAILDVTGIEGFRNSGGRFTEDREVAYLYAFLNSPVDQEVTFTARGKMRPVFWVAWVNGQRITHSMDGHPLNFSAKLPLKTGWNEVLFRLAREHPRAKFEISIIPENDETVQWYPEPSEDSKPGHVKVAGPYYVDIGSPRGGQPTVPNEIEELILKKSPGSRVDFPGTGVELEFGSGKNIALTIAIEELIPGKTDGLADAGKLMDPGSGPAIVNTRKAGSDVYVTLDFGKVLSGHPRIRLNGVEGGIVDIGYSETLLDGRVDAVRGGLNMADRYIMKDGPQEFELFFYKGFRFLQATFRNCDKPVEVESISVNFTSYPVEYRGAFECSDPLLNKIWDLGRWTTQICMHDGYEDTPWREQGQWLGDAQVELLVNYVAFGDIELGSKGIRQFAQGQREDGLIPAMYPAKEDPLPDGIATFMAQWVSILLDHYRYSADLDLVEELYPNMEKVMEYLGSFVDEHGLMAEVRGFTFLDWMPEQTLMPAFFEYTAPGELTGMNAFYYRALQDAAKLAVLMGRTSQQEEWQQAAEVVRNAINERMWSEEEKLHVHARIGDEISERWAVHNSIMAAYAEVPSADIVQASFDRLLATTTAEAVQIGSPYFYFFYLEALRRAERHQAALDVVRESYGRMVDAGATSTWEEFNGYTSLSHGWSAAPTYDLSTYVLGVKLTEPGYSAFRVEPQPADLDWAKGVIPTIQGDIEVEWKRRDGEFELKLNIPYDGEAEILIPSRDLESAKFAGALSPEDQSFKDGKYQCKVTGKGDIRITTRL